MLFDPDGSVRAVAAAALGHMLTGAVDQATRDLVVHDIDQLRRHDDDAFAQDSAEKAYQLVKGLPSQQVVTAPAAGAVYVELGRLTYASPQLDARLLQVAHRDMEAALSSAFATRWPGDDPPTLRDLAAAGVSGFVVDASFTQLDVTRAKGKTIISCAARTSISTFDGQAVGQPVGINTRVEPTTAGTAELAIWTSSCMDGMTKALMKHAVGAITAFAAVAQPQPVARSPSPSAAAARPVQPILHAVITDAALTHAPDDLRALRLALSDCDAESLALWMQFPVTVDGASVADATAAAAACHSGAIPTVDAGTLTTALAHLEVDAAGALRVPLGATAWRFAWRADQWWLTAVDTTR